MWNVNTIPERTCFGKWRNAKPFKNKCGMHKHASGTGLIQIELLSLLSSVVKWIDFDQKFHSNSTRPLWLMFVLAQFSSDGNQLHCENERFCQAWPGTREKKAYIIRKINNWKRCNAPIGVVSIFLRIFIGCSLYSCYSVGLHDHFSYVDERREWRAFSAQWNGNEATKWKNISTNTHTQTQLCRRNGWHARSIRAYTQLALTRMILIW